MKNITLSEYQQLCHNAITLADDEYGKKVLELTDHTIIKLFRVKRFISQATLYSPARRFAKNAQRLIQLNIPTINLIALYKIKSIKRTAVHYHQLKGVTVREYLDGHPNDNNFLLDLGKFLAHLHHLGILFRSAHFGNIIFTSENTFGLIDISDMKIYKSPLNRNKRLRNLKHIFRLKEDLELLKGTDSIERSYLKHCGINKKKFHQDFMMTCCKLKNKGNIEICK